MTLSRSLFEETTTSADVFELADFLKKTGEEFEEGEAIGLCLVVIKPQPLGIDAETTWALANETDPMLRACAIAGLERILVELRATSKI